MINEEKLKALDAAISKLEKDYGKGTVMRLGDAKADTTIEAIPTGSMSLDIALGVGGIPKGRVIEIYGPESSGKTTVALHVIAEAQKLGGIAGFIDAEHALDVSISTICISRSRIPVSRHSRYVRLWCAPARWI